MVELTYHYSIIQTWLLQNVRTDPKPPMLNTFPLIMQIICHHTVGTGVPISVRLLSSTTANLHLLNIAPDPLQQQMQDLVDRCVCSNSVERPGMNQVAEEVKTILNAVTAIRPPR